MTSIITFVVGVILGTYIASQIERSVSTNIRKNKMIDNINNLDKNKEKND